MSQDQNPDRAFMQDRVPSSATIINLPPNPQADLRIALRKMELALAEQKTSVLAWREDLVKLAETIKSLRSSVEDYRIAIDVVAASVTKAAD